MYCLHECSCKLISKTYNSRGTNVALHTQASSHIDSQIDVCWVVTSNSLYRLIGSTFAENARYVDSIPALDTLFSVYIRPIMSLEIQ